MHDDRPTYTKIKRLFCVLAFAVVMLAAWFGIAYALNASDIKKEVKRMEELKQSEAKYKELYEKLKKEGANAPAVLIVPEEEKAETKEEEEKEGDTVTEWLTLLTQNFLKAEFTYNDLKERTVNMKTYMTEGMKEIYDNPYLSGGSPEVAPETAGEGDSLRCAGRAGDITVYKVTEKNGKATAIARMEYTFQTEGQTEIKNEALIELTFAEVEGEYFVDNQVIYNLVK